MSNNNQYLTITIRSGKMTIDPHIPVVDEAPIAESEKLVTNSESLKNK